jgi:hypothetical protein
MLRSLVNDVLTFQRDLLFIYADDGGSIFFQNISTYLTTVSHPRNLSKLGNLCIAQQFWHICSLLFTYLTNHKNYKKCTYHKIHASVFSKTLCQTLCTLINIQQVNSVHELSLRSVFVGFHVKSPILLSDFNQTQNQLILRRSRSWPVISI